MLSSLNQRIENRRVPPRPRTDLFHYEKSGCVSHKQNEIGFKKNYPEIS